MYILKIVDKEKLGVLRLAGSEPFPRWSTNAGQIPSIMVWIETP
jgi:hypothetical protein